MITTPRGEPSINFSEPEAVKALNRALLENYYDIKNWDIPPGYLCPPIPGRADLIHSVADLLATHGEIPRGDTLRVLDIGVGSSLIYPLLGRCEYGWRFVASDIDPEALESSARILKGNPKLADGIELRRQVLRETILKGIVQPGESFDAIVCNPPFHASLAEAEAGSRRKWQNLGQSPDKKTSAFKVAPKLNFGGQPSELWCSGGEASFIGRMAAESTQYKDQVRWFTALVSKETSLPAIRQAITKAGAREERIIEMGQGQKKSRLVAWCF